MTDRWFGQSAESAPAQVALVVVHIPPHRSHALPLDQAIHRHTLHLQVTLAAADLQVNHLTRDLYLLVSLALIHDLHSRLPVVQHHLVLNQGQRKQL